MKKVSYKEDSQLFAGLKTPCPHKKGVMVGSAWCTAEELPGGVCKHSGGKVAGEKAVYCNAE